jgi:hypothetical protein
MKNCRCRSATNSPENANSAVGARPSPGMGKPSLGAAASTATASAHSTPRAQPCAAAPVSHGSADTPAQNSCRASSRCSPPRVASTRKRKRPRPTSTATYAPANTRPRAPNASGVTAANTAVPSIDPMTSSWIAGRPGSYLSPIPTVLPHTSHMASSSTTVWKASLQPRCASSPRESWNRAKTNTRSKNRSRNVARSGSSGLRRRVTARFVMVSPVLSSSYRYGDHVARQPTASFASPFGIGTTSLG